MFGISFGEIIFILIIALIVLGPKQLAHVVSKFWMLIVSIRTQLEVVKDDLYKKSGLNDIKNLHHDTLNGYKNLKQQILNDIPLEHNLTLEESIFYQPELDFDREPELFDEIY